MKFSLKKIVRTVALIIAIGFVLFLIQETTIAGVSHQYRFEDPALVPAAPVALVLGAQVHADGSLSWVLADRVTAAVDLYSRGKVKKLLMSGDNSSTHYDEVTAMKNFAMNLGVPESAIALDYAGFSTYESCYRAQAIFGVTDAIVVTQGYHLPRAVYTCRKLGIQAVGLGLPDWEKYPTLMLRAYPREVLAHTKMVWELYITQPDPKFLGDPEFLDFL